MWFLLKMKILFIIIIVYDNYLLIIVIFKYFNNDMLQKDINIKTLFDFSYLTWICDRNLIN